MRKGWYGRKKQSRNVLKQRGEVLFFLIDIERIDVIAGLTCVCVEASTSHPLIIAGQPTRLRFGSFRRFCVDVDYGFDADAPCLDFNAEAPLSSLQLSDQHFN